MRAHSHLTPRTVAVTAPITPGPMALAAASRVAPVVSTSSTRTAPATRRAARKRGGVRPARPAPACRGHHHPGRRARQTGRPVAAASDRASSAAGSIPCRHSRSRARGTGTSTAAPAGSRAAIAAASHGATPPSPRYFRSSIRRRAGPSCRHAPRTSSPPGRRRSGAATKRRRQPSQIDRTGPPGPHPAHQITIPTVPGGSDRKLVTTFRGTMTTPRCGQYGGR